MPNDTSMTLYDTFYTISLKCHHHKTLANNSIQARMTL